MSDPEYLTVAEVAELLRVTTRTVLSNIKQGRIPALRLDRAYRVPASALKALEVKPVSVSKPKTPRKKTRTPSKRA